MPTLISGGKFREKKKGLLFNTASLSLGESDMPSAAVRKSKNTHTSVTAVKMGPGPLSRFITPSDANLNLGSLSPSFLGQNICPRSPLEKLGQSISLVWQQHGEGGWREGGENERMDGRKSALYVIS